MVWILPTTLEVEGVEYGINSDFRPCLSAMQAMDDILIPDIEGYYFAMNIIFGEGNLARIKNHTQALSQMAWFLNCGRESTSRDSVDFFAPPMIDWEQDGWLIFSGIAQTIGRDIRMDDYCHFWSFMAYFQGMGECTFTIVRSIRYKLAKRVKLENWEQEFYRKNRDIVDVKKDAQAREDLFNQVFGLA